MYPPPDRLTARTAHRLPDRFRVDEEPNEWVRDVRPGMRLHSFLEGPAVDRAGNLFCVDIPYGRIFRVAAGGEWSLVAQYDGWPNGLAIHRDGRLFIADARNGIVACDPANGAITTVVAEFDGIPFQGCNDLTFGRSGDLYFTDPGASSLSRPTGRVYCLRNDGRLELLADALPYPNGLVLNLAETYLDIALTDANAIWRVPAAAGIAHRPCRMFIQLSGGLAGPDGMALDEQGNLLVAHARHATVWHFSPCGEPLARIETPNGNWTTNVTLHGRSAFITEAEAGEIAVADVPHAGHPLFSHASPVGG